MYGEFTPCQLELCEDLRDMGIEEETAVLILSAMDTDEKADEYLDWLIENQNEITEGKLLKKVVEMETGKTIEELLSDEK